MTDHKELKRQAREAIRAKHGSIFIAAQCAAASVAKVSYSTE